MIKESKCLVDTNVWVQLFDEGSNEHGKASMFYRQFEEANTRLYVPSAVFVECLHIFQKLWKVQGMPDRKQKLRGVIVKMFQVPTLHVLSDPDAHSYLEIASLMAERNLTATDALILHEAIDNQIACICTFDKQLAKTAKKYGIKILD